jgi:hypothetical protein
MNKFGEQFMPRVNYFWIGATAQSASQISGLCAVGCYPCEPEIHIRVK